MPARHARSGTRDGSSTGERRLCKLRAGGSIPSRSTGFNRSDVHRWRWSSWPAGTISTTAFERTSKRRKGFPSETKVKHGSRGVHGDQELLEKLGRDDPCTCGSGRRFQALLPPRRPLRWLGARPLLFASRAERTRDLPSIRWCVSSAWPERPPVEREVTGSSPVRIASAASTGMWPAGRSAWVISLLPPADPRHAAPAQREYGKRTRNPFHLGRSTRPRSSLGGRSSRRALIPSATTRLQGPEVEDYR